jgi:hypothetical protein
MFLSGDLARGCAAQPLFSFGDDLVNGTILKKKLGFGWIAGGIDG